MKSRFSPSFRGISGYNETSPNGAGNTIRALTPALDLSKEGLAMKATQIPERVKIRAATKYVLDPERGCHISTYSVGSHGYAQIGWSVPGQRTSAMMLVHRVIWMTHYGDIDPGMTVDHMCKQRKCINIKHLRLLTNFENGRRTGGRDWPLGQCINGHPNSNLHTRASGKTVCRLCNQEWQAKYQAKKRAEKSADALNARAS